MERCHFQKAHLYTFVHIATEKDPQLQQSSYRERYGSKTYDLVPKRTIWLQNRRFWLPKQQQRRHTRARFCRLGPLDRTRLRCRTTVPQLVSRPDQRPPSGRASFALAPDPPEHGHRFMYRAVPECTWGVDFNKAGDRLKRYHCPSGTPPMGPSLQTGST